MDEIRWEYKVHGWNCRICTADDSDLEQILNRYGNEGWELVNIIPQVNGEDGYIQVEFNILVFKRELA